MPSCSCAGAPVAKRYVLTLLAFIGNFLMIAIRSNMSMALPEITADKNITRGNETVTVVSTQLPTCFFKL